MLREESPDITIVIPSWNEKDNLELLLPQLHETLAVLNLRYEVLVVDAGSSDGTAEAAVRLHARVVLQEQRGYGGALIAGFAASAAPFIVTMDADLSHRPVFIHELWKRRSEAEVLVASRYIPGGRSEVSGLRSLLSRILNLVYRHVLSLPIRDLSSGFRMYRRETVAHLNLRSRDFDVLEEILITLYNQGGRVLEIPFHYMPRGSGRSHAKLIKFGWAYLKTLLRMWRLRHSGARCSS